MGSTPSKSTVRHINITPDPRTTITPSNPPPPTKTTPGKQAGNISSSSKKNLTENNNISQPTTVGSDSKNKTQLEAPTVTGGKVGSDSKNKTQEEDSSVTGSNSKNKTQLEEPTVTRGFVGSDSKNKTQLEEPTVTGGKVGSDSKKKTQSEEPTVTRGFVGSDSKNKTQSEQPTVTRGFVGSDSKNKTQQEEPSVTGSNSKNKTQPEDSNPATPPTNPSKPDGQKMASNPGGLTPAPPVLPFRATPHGPLARPKETPEETHKRLLATYKETCLSNLEQWRENKQAQMPQARIIDDTNSIFFAMRRFSPDWITKHRTAVCSYIEKEKDIITVLCESTMNAGIDEASGQFSQAGLLVIVNLSDHSRELSKVICGVPGYLKFLYDILQKHKHSADTLLSSVEKLVIRVLMIIHNLAMTDSNIPVLQEKTFTEVLRVYLSFPNETIRLTAVLGMADIMTEEESHYVEANTSVIAFLLSMFKTSLTSSAKTARDGHGMIWGVLELAKGIGRLARNDGNKKLLVNKGCLPLLLKLAKSSDMEEQKEALKSIWALAFDEGNQDKILEEPGLISFLDEQHKTGATDTKATCYGILWTMRYKLLQSDQHSAIGKRLTTKHSSPKHQVLEKADREKSEKEEKASAGTKGHVMISYQWANQEILMKIRDRIRGLDEKVWMDIDDMEGSTLQAMADAIENADVVLICMSRKYKDSPNCRAEAEYAHQLRKKVIPLIMERGYRPDGWLGMILGAKLFYDFSGKYPFESKIDALLKEVHQTVNGIAKPLPSTSAGTVDYDVVDGPSDVIVPERSQTLGASRRLGPVKNWDQQQVKDWLKKHELSGSRVEKLNCKEIAFLQKVQQMAPEFYYQMLKSDLGLKTLSELANFEAAMDDLP